MNLKLKKPLVVFDIEATGLDVINDRIVEISFVKVLPSGEKDILTRRFNPGKPMTKEAAMVTGIYDKDLKDEPTFKSQAEELSKFIEGCDLAGYNSMKFDVPMLSEEFRRSDVDFTIDGRHLVDVMKIYHIKN